MQELNAYNPRSTKLIQCLINNDRIELNKVKSEIMIGAKPNFEVIFANKPTSLRQLKTTIGHDNLVKLVIVILEDLVNYFNVQRPMNEDQIVDLAFEVCEQLKFDSIEEFISFCEGIKKGAFGKIYERFDAPTFWKMYWGEDENDVNSYNYKKMDFCHLDATRNQTKDPIVRSELEEQLLKPRSSGQAVQSFIDRVGKLPKTPPTE